MGSEYKTREIKKKKRVEVDLCDLELNVRDVKETREDFTAVRSNNEQINKNKINNTMVTLVARTGQFLLIIGSCTPRMGTVSCPT